MTQGVSILSFKGDVKRHLQSSTPSSVKCYNQLSRRLLRDSTAVSFGTPIFELYASKNHWRMRMNLKGERGDDFNTFAYPSNHNPFLYFNF